MPLPKRQVEPVHVARGTLPEELAVPSELEAVTNGTLANTVRQLSSLSRHAEDLFGELQREAASLASRASSVQARIDRLALKVTQLDSGGEEGTPDLLPLHRQQQPLLSLQDMHLRKAFKSSVVFDQQVVSRDTMPSAMLEQYRLCDKPPPLDKLNPYRDDGKDGLKFYTDPNYFFDLWRQEMLKDTERMMHDRGKKPHRPRGAEGGGRHKKRVRQPHNTRERQRQIAVGHGEYIMPDANPYRSPKLYDEDIDARPPRPNSIELRSNYGDDGRGQGLPSPRHSHMQDQGHYGRGHYASGYEEAAAMYLQQQQQQSHYARGMAGDPYHSPHGMAGRNSISSRGSSVPMGPGTPGQRPSQPPPAPPSSNNSNTSTPTTLSATGTPTRGRSMSATRDTLPPPPPPPNDMTSPPASNGPLPPHLRSHANSPHHATPPRLASPPPHHYPEPHDLPPPPPAPEDEHPPAPLPPPPPSPPQAAPPPPPPPPPPPAGLSNGPLAPPPMMNGDVGKAILKSPPTKKSGPAAPPPVDPRSDLLKAIRDGIKLRKVEKSEQKEVERSNALHDVASILARRVAVEFSDSESGSESECDSEGWEEEQAAAAAAATT